MREVGNDMYSVGAYFWSKICSEAPFSILIPFIFGAIVYYPLKLNTTHGYNFWIFQAVLVLVYNASQGYGLVVSTAIPDKTIAVALTPLVMVPPMMFTGFFLPQSQIPSFLDPIKYVSLYKYGY